MSQTEKIPLIVAPYSKTIPGGIGTWIKNLKDFSDSGEQGPRYDILVYTNQMKNITNTRMLSRIVTGILLYTKLIFLVLSTVRKKKPSVLHLTSSASISLFKDLFLIRLSDLMHIPVVMHWHFGKIPYLAEKQNWEWRLLGRVIRRSRFSIVLDTSSFRVLSEAGFSNLVKIPNPIGKDVEDQSIQARRNTRQNHSGRILFVGHLIKEKGVFELVEACSQIPFITELLLAGPYEIQIRKELIKLASARADCEWLRFSGILPEKDVLEKMRTFPIVALPSYAEGFPYVVLEAMAMECAVIATEVGAIPEILAVESDTPCGICVPVKSISRLKESILELSMNPEKCAEMGRNGSERVLKNYTIGNVVEQYKSIWTNAVRG